ncbi:hypothetical protein CGRA01v4_11650 [Colletotrichum graminicola]|nr:hypothetical protein CGRA01v4_11650 [Colletotrichum graminicola]
MPFDCSPHSQPFLQPFLKMDSLFRK